jgi:hypothetical protein
MRPGRPLISTILLAASASLLLAGAAGAETILFVGNSFTFGALSPVWRYRASTVADLNGDGVGGVPALFKLFTDEAGLSYDVSLATHPGIGLDWHWANSFAKLDKAWDHVVLQDYSTLDKDKPGDPALLVDYTRRWAEAFTARNPAVDIRLTATWSRADLTFKTPSPWTGRSIFAMADDVSCGYGLAAKASPQIKAVVEVGEAFNRAIRSGVADGDPYEGLPYGQVNFWAWDNYHASAFGYYLEALMVFGSVTGRDPESLGSGEQAALELGFSPQQTAAVQAIAHDELAAPAQDHCTASPVTPIAAPLASSGWGEARWNSILAR